ncbi:MAG: BamA/TamA family outer membrane protein [Chitinophagaceae bacterium]
MKKIISCLIISIFHFTSVVAQTDTLEQRIFLVGDAGELENGKHPVIDWLAKNVDWNDEKNMVIFLGDNIYPYGMPDRGASDYKEAQRVLDYQINLVKGKKATAYFIMGNHDWLNGKIGGWERAMNQVNYINSLELTNVSAEPREGCPGPVEVGSHKSRESHNEKAVVVLMDSHWFLHVHDRPGATSHCEAKTADEFQTELKQIVAAHPDQLVILAMHHPIHTHGVHGGKTYTIKDHLFPLTNLNRALYIPLPILGSIYPFARGTFGNLQDEHHPLYKGMTNMIEQVLHKNVHTVVVSGHDHSLQLLQHDSMWQIVSGSAAKISRISDKQHGKEVLLAEPVKGFGTLEIRKSGKVEAKFYNLYSANINTPFFSHTIATIVPKTAIASIDSIGPLGDSITWVANPRLAGSGLKNFLMGKNYRKEWTDSVTVPVLDIGTEQGGLMPDKQGGGKQTKSLRFTDKNKKDWALRSIEKYPEAAIPADLRSGFAKDLVEQGVSASYPYASLSIEPMAKAAGIPVLRRRLVFVPDDPRLGRFREEFKNTLGILEERQPAGVKKAYNTDELVLRLAKDNDDHVDQKSVLRARLLDNFIMDFDRHEDQWQWATRDTGRGKIYYAIPRDHDQAFFVSQGLIPRFVRKPWLVPEIQGFREETDNIKTFNRPARNFDRFFLNELSAEEWQKEIDTFLSAMTDDVIEASLHRQPKEVQQYSMNKIISTLQKKRKHFREDITEYYEFISREVDVVGSNQKELFTITKNNDGTVHVVSNKIDKEGNISSKIYDRLLDPNITNEIRIYGLSDDDVFKVEGGDSPIKIRIIGGPGNDEFTNNGSAGKVLVYDASFEENKFTGNPGLTSKVSIDPQVNRYNRFGHKYDFINPGISVAYNIDDGLYLGAKLEMIRQGFRKEPYRMRQYIEAHRALRTASYNFKYEGDFIHAVGNYDLTLRADVRAPINVTNFFGIGNNTSIDESKPKREYYRARYDIADASVLLRKQLQSWMRFSYGPTFQYFRLEEDQNKNHFISNTRLSGLDSATLYKGHTYAGGLFNLSINSKLNQVLPTRGFTLDLNVRPLLGINKYSSNLVQFNADMAVFISVTPQARTVLATRVGYGHNFGDYEFPQAHYLSGTENLRGYRKHRFAGRTMFFNNTEVRFKILDFNTYLFPGTLGLHAFHDVGRVWSVNDTSNDWHNGFGAGIWIAPIRRFVLTGSLTFSKEEKALPLLTFGYFF